VQSYSYFELVDLLVAELDRRFNQPGMNKLLVIERVLTGTVQPDDIDVIMNSYSVFITSRSSLILESLSDLFDGDQDHRNMSDVLSKLRDVHQKKRDVAYYSKTFVCLQESTWPALSQVLNARERSACCVG